MRIFVTGASGWIGSAVVPMLLERGHEVVGLARSDQAAEKLQGLGAAVLRGDLDDVKTLRSGAGESDAVIHLAFRHDLLTGPDGFARATALDRQAIDTMGQVLVGTGRPFVIASGTPAIPGKVAVESDQPGSEGPAGGRGTNARAVIELAERGVRSSVVRLPRSVHGEGDPGFMRRLIATAREGRFRLRRRRFQPLAGRARARCRPPILPRTGEGSGRIGAARGRGRRGGDSRYRGGDRPQAGPASKVGAA